LTGTVLLMLNDDNGEFVTVRLDGADVRNHRYRASNLERIESLF
jgi:hypothetical protein